MADKKKDKRAKDEAKAAPRPTTSAGRPRKAAAAPRLPETRDELMVLHRETRARRNSAPHGSAEHVAAIELIGRIEVQIARIERAMDPPLG
ncbi:MAG TPA: hypothetical protein VGQ89_14610 [Candidatus Limnocylindrales bacterium]|nr:hypothetical protein [Candidatus Limnocylindrales bacterium]